MRRFDSFRPSQVFNGLAIPVALLFPLIRGAIPTIVPIVFGFKETPTLRSRGQALAFCALDIDAGGLWGPVPRQRHDALLGYLGIT
jgi:hypothetical protein